MKKPTTLLGVTILTPALIAGEAHATPARTSAVAADTAALARLKAGMLALDPAAKLELAADRLPATSTSTSTTTTRAVVHAATSANCHTQHNNAQTHHNAITQPTSAVATTSAAPSGGAPTASPSTAPAHGALTPPPPQGVTKGPQGFQPPQQGVTKGSN